MTWALTSGELKQMHQRAISILKYRRGRFILDPKAMHRPGIEPGSQEWESCMIPLHQRRVFLHHDTIFGSVISIQLRSAISHRSAITTVHNWNSRHHALTILYTSNSHNHNVIQLNFFYNFKQHKLNLHRHAVVSIIQTYRLIV